MPGDGTVLAGVAQALAAHIAANREELLGLLRAMVAEQSVLGNEEPVQRIVEARLRALGFETQRVEVDAEAAFADPNAGQPMIDYDGRSSVVGHLSGNGGGRSMHLSGHVDVVPVDHPELWEHDPWGGELVDGRVYGRGSSDMKGGVAAYLIAAEAVIAVCPERRGDLILSTVIEEECTGNGMWSVLGAGHVGDAVLVGESTGLRLAHAATGVVWCRLVAAGGPATRCWRPERVPSTFLREPSPRCGGSRTRSTRRWAIRISPRPASGRTG